MKAEQARKIATKRCIDKFDLQELQKEKIAREQHERALKQLEIIYDRIEINAKLGSFSMNIEGDFLEETIQKLREDGYTISQTWVGINIKW